MDLIVVIKLNCRFTRGRLISFAMTFLNKGVSPILIVRFYACLLIVKLFGLLLIYKGLFMSKYIIYSLVNRFVVDRFQQRKCFLIYYSIFLLFFFFGIYSFLLLIHSFLLFICFVAAQSVKKTVLLLIRIRNVSLLAIYIFTIVSFVLFRLIF